jgi:hypothetical protein
MRRISTVVTALVLSLTLMPATTAYASGPSIVVMSKKCDVLSGWIGLVEMPLSYVTQYSGAEGERHMRRARNNMKDLRKAARDSENKALASAYLRLAPKPYNLAKAKGLLADLEDNINRGKC